MDQIELQSPKVNTRKINLGTIKIQLLGVIETVKLINKTDNNETTQYILRQLQGLTDIIQQDLHVIEITGELPEQHTDRFIEENQEPDLSQYNLNSPQYSKPNDHIPRAHTINEIKQTIIMIYFIKEKTPLQERLEGYLEQERGNYPELDQYIKNKEWNNQQYFNIKEDYMEITNEKAYNKWIKEEKEKERNEEILRDNELINAWEIIKEANKSEPWTNFNTYEEYITQTEKQSTVQILKAKEYFAKELIRMIVKNWKYEYPREQFEETEENITKLMIKEHDNFELADLKTRIRLTKNECLQHYLSTWKTRQLREKLNNIFDKPSREGILKTLNQDSYTSKLMPIHVQPLTRYEVKLTKAKLPFNKPYELTNIPPFNEPLFNQLTLMEHLEESLYIRIAANKKSQLTEGQYQDWQQQMSRKIEKQYNTLYNKGRQFSLKNIMKNQIKEGYDNLHEMLNHDQLKLNFIAMDRAIVVGKTTTCYWLKTWLQSYEQNKIPNRTYTVYSTQFFTEEIITNQEEKEKLNQLLQHSTFKLLPNKMNYTIFCNPGQEQMLQWFKKRSKEGNKGTDRQIPKDYLIKINNKYREMIKQVHPNYIRINNNIPNLEH
ncbi:30421_t:CDS:2, partial [Gigaspora margarita]